MSKPKSFLLIFFFVGLFFGSIFLTVTYTDANGSTLNEMALVMNDGSLYSMATFGDIVKTNTMQITFNWRINYI